MKIALKGNRFLIELLYMRLVIYYYSTNFLHMRNLDIYFYTKKSMHNLDFSFKINKLIFEYKR